MNATTLLSHSRLLRKRRPSRKLLCFSSTTTTDDELRREASSLTRHLYRLCLRSARILQTANEHDEREFAQREEDYLKPGNRSMLPPPDRTDELRSRYEYYCQYARECFGQEADCLQAKVLTVAHWDRYLHHLQSGEAQRVWLLKDMQFEDPQASAFDRGRVDALRTRVEDRAQALRQAALGAVSAAVMPEDDDDDDDWTTSDEEDEMGEGWSSDEEDC